MFALARALRVHITAEQVAAVVRAKLDRAPVVENTLLVDVRSTGEVAATGVIPTAVNIPLKMLEAALDDTVETDEFTEIFGVAKPKKEVTQIIFYCAHGVRSAVAVEIAEGLGFSGARNFSGSFAEWHYRYGGPSSAGDGTASKAQ
ncbi:endoplasmic reticulum protein [Trypanosoma grayi]|uniref:endoplasmic reticulum protein n=1 Tax=Trypanosoma grayi TaxID=71804 RepID=UPI0004F42606|nr:endoplasmic reticulum protein [Trypanosoma grayi]KEG12002.1 endoplasmic reticulum protein [Trypanosoma grayi]